MSSSPTTHLLLFLRSEEEEHALYFVTGEIFIEREVIVVEALEDHHLYPIASPFLIPLKEKRITLALAIPPTPKHINEIADLVATGLLLGFLIREEIDLDGRIINNLGNAS